MKEGVPRLRMKAAVTRHLLPVLLRMIEIHFPPLQRPRPPNPLVPAMSLPRVRGIPQLVGEAIAAKGKGTFPQARRTLHVACVESVSSWTAVAPVAPETEASRNASRVRSDWEPSTVLSCGDESAIGWASNVAETVHVSVLPRALMQKFLVWLDKTLWFGWRRVTLMTPNAEIQESHDIHTHAQKQTKVDTCEDRKNGEIDGSSSFFRKHDGFCPFPCRPSKNRRSEPLEPVVDPKETRDDMRVGFEEESTELLVFAERSKGPNTSKPTGRHNLFLHVPKDPNCGVCKLMKTTGAPCRNRLETSVDRKL